MAAAARVLPGLVAAALGWKSNPTFTPSVLMTVFGRSPVVTELTGYPSPKAAKDSISPALAGLAADTRLPSACLKSGVQSVPAPGGSESQLVITWILSGTANSGRASPAT